MNDSALPSSSVPGGNLRWWSGAWRGPQGRCLPPSSFGSGGGAETAGPRWCTRWVCWRRPATTLAWLTCTLPMRQTTTSSCCWSSELWPTFRLHSMLSVQSVAILKVCCSHIHPISFLHYICQVLNPSFKSAIYVCFYFFLKCKPIFVLYRGYLRKFLISETVCVIMPWTSLESVLIYTESKKTESRMKNADGLQSTFCA